MIAHPCQGHLRSQMRGHSLIHSGENTQELEVRFPETPCPSSSAPSPRRWTQKSIGGPNTQKMCECSWVLRKVCVGGLIPGWGTGMAPMGTGEAVKGQERWVI